MISELIQLSFDKIMQTRTYTVIILGARNKKFAIYTEPSVGRILQLFLTGAEKPRPLTHELIHNILIGFGIRVKQVVITDVQDTIYFARIFLEKDDGDIRQVVEIDVRPSDCIMLALMTNAPIYCLREVLEKIIPVKE